MGVNPMKRSYICLVAALTMTFILSATSAMAKPKHGSNADRSTTKMRTVKTGNNFQGSTGKVVQSKSFTARSSDVGSLRDRNVTSKPRTAAHPIIEALKAAKELADLTGTINVGQMMDQAKKKLQQQKQ
jgi:hypothetical protein